MYLQRKGFNIMAIIVLLVLISNLRVPAVSVESPRTLGTEEVLRLTDESGEFVFKNLSDIKVNGTGEVFIYGGNQLHHFDSLGSFKGNMARNGEGPGELKHFADFFPVGSEIVVGSFMPTKVMTFDGSGKLMKEIKIEGVKPFTGYAFSLHGWHYLYESQIDFQAIKTGINIRVQQMVRADGNGKVERTDLQFETLDAVIKRTHDGGGMTIATNDVTSLLDAFDGRRFLYVSTDERYGVDQIDLSTHKTVKRFIRDFSPVPYKMPDDLDAQDKEMERIAGRKYFNDIWALCCLGEDLMVFTSHLDEKNRVLVDRYSSEGRRIDSFFLTVPGVRRPDDLKNKPLCFDKDFFWTSFVDDDDNPVVVKYRVDWTAGKK